MENLESPGREFPTPSKAPPEIQHMDSRGVLYAEYSPRIQMEAIPQLSQEGLKEVLWYLERDGLPKDIQTALSKIDTMINHHMKYDAMNYLLGEILDSRPESFIATINHEKIGISESQLKVLQLQIPTLQEHLKNLYKEFSENSSSPDLSVAVQDLEGIKKMLKWAYGYEIAYFLSEDQAYILGHHATYNVSVGKLLREGVGQCHTFAALGKLILESGKWNLGIQSIEYLASPSGDHTVLEIVMMNGEKVIWDGTKGMVK